MQIQRYIALSVTPADRYSSSSRSMTRRLENDARLSTIYALRSFAMSFFLFSSPFLILHVIKRLGVRLCCVGGIRVAA